MWDLKGNEKTQEQLDAYKRKLRFSKASTIKTISLASVIYRMIFKQENTYYIYEADDVKKETETHQCSGSRLRSVEDIYSVAKNYVKNITREKVEIAITKLIQSDLISQSFCSTVQRRVHSARSLTTKLTKIKEVIK